MSFIQSDLYTNLNWMARFLTRPGGVPRGLNCYEYWKSAAEVYYVNAVIDEAEAECFVLALSGESIEAACINIDMRETMDDITEDAVKKIAEAVKKSHTLKVFELSQSTLQENAQQEGSWSQTKGTDRVEDVNNKERTVDKDSLDDEGDGCGVHVRRNGFSLQL
jgi:Ser-tRNA(Ala) deacylase AlaX